MPTSTGRYYWQTFIRDDVISQVQNVIRDSLLYGIANPEEPLATMRAYAQEFNDAVLMNHVALYVNEWTVELGSVGRNALDELSRRARLGNGKQTSLQVFG